MDSTLSSPSYLDSLSVDVFSHLVQYLSALDISELFCTQSRRIQQKLLWPGVILKLSISPSTSGFIAPSIGILVKRLENLRFLQYSQQKPQLLSLGFDCTDYQAVSQDSVELLESMCCHELEELELTVFPKIEPAFLRKRWKTCRALFPKLERLVVREPTRTSYQVFPKFWENFLSELPTSLKSMTLGISRWTSDFSVLPPSLTSLRIIDTYNIINSKVPNHGYLDSILIHLTQQRPHLQQISLLPLHGYSMFDILECPDSVTDLELSLPFSTIPNPLKGGKNLTRLSLRVFERNSRLSMSILPPSVTELIVGLAKPNSCIWLENDSIPHSSALTTFHFDSGQRNPMPHLLQQLVSKFPNLTDIKLTDCETKSLYPLPVRLRSLFLSDLVRYDDIQWKESYQLPLTLERLHLELLSEFPPSYIPLIPPGLKKLFICPKRAWSDEDLMKLTVHASQLEILEFPAKVYFSHPSASSNHISPCTTNFTITDHVGRVTRRRSPNQSMKLLRVKWQLWSPPGMVMQLKDDGLRLPNTLKYLNLQDEKLPCLWSFQMTANDLAMHLSLLPQLTTLVISFPFTHQLDSLDVSAISLSLPLLQRLEIKKAKTTNLHLAALPRPLIILKLNNHNPIVQINTAAPIMWKSSKSPTPTTADPQIDTFYHIINDMTLALCLDYMPINMKVFCVPNAHFLSSAIQEWPEEMEKVSISTAPPEWTPMQQLLFADNFTKSCNLNLES